MLSIIDIPNTINILINECTWMNSHLLLLFHITLYPALIPILIHIILLLPINPVPVPLFLVSPVPVLLLPLPSTLLHLLLFLLIHHPSLHFVQHFIHSMVFVPDSFQYVYLIFTYIFILLLLLLIYIDMYSFEDVFLVNEIMTPQFIL